MRHEAVFPDAVHRQACDLLLRHVRKGRKQEELCFALWRPSTGAERESALIFRIIPPLEGERRLHGAASFESSYLARAVKLARENQAGLAFMHNHLAPGWQGMSEADVIAERDRISPPARACDHPLVGLTLGTDSSWSARFWIWDGRVFQRRWCDKVRVIGRGIRITYNDHHIPPPERRAALRRTIDTWGEARQRDIARLRVGIVGVGSVGCMVAEALARMGIQHMVLIDADKIEVHNLDRLLYAGEEDIGVHKAEFVARNLRRGATAAEFRVDVRIGWIQEQPNYLAALDCDVLFAAVDRPLPKDVLNHIAYAHCIPVVFGGIFVDKKANDRLGQAAWSVVVAGPDGRCLRCDGQYTTSDVVMERDGSLDDPTYIHRDSRESRLNDERRNENVFPFSANLASYMVLEMIRLIVRESWWPATTGKLHYSLIPNRLSVGSGVCNERCSIWQSTARGDFVKYPFIVDAIPRREETSGFATWLKVLVKSVVRCTGRIFSGRRR